MDSTQIAEIAYEINRAYCEAIGDSSQVSWSDTNEEVKVSAVNGVEFCRAQKPTPTPEDNHINWMELKLASGWRYGEIKNETEKTHPCLVAHAALPLAQRVKDHLFIAVVEQFRLQSGITETPLPDITETPRPNITETHLPVTYIGHRAMYSDGIFDTGIYAKDETKLVPANIARQMFKHTAVYVPGDTQKVQSTVADPQSEKKKTGVDDLEEVQSAVDSVMNMRKKDAVLEFAATHFSNMQLNKRHTLDSIQQETVEMIHKYGLT